MNKNKLILRLQGLTALLLLALSLAACGTNSSATSAPAPTSAATTSGVATTSAASTTTAPATTAAATVAAAATTPAAKPAATSGGNLKAEITIADGLRQDETGLLKAQIDAFKKANPNVKVTSLHFNPEELSELVKSAAGTNAAPDLIIAPADYVSDWVAGKVIQPADKVFDTSLVSGYAPNALGASKLNGTQWGVPFNYGNVPVLLYNKKLVPNPPATTDEMIKIAADITNKGSSKRDRDYGMAIDINQPVWFTAFLGGFGGSLLDSSNQPTLNTPEMVSTLQFYQDLVKQKVANAQYEAGMNQLDYAFRDGRLGMMVTGDWDISAYGSAKLPKKVAAVATAAATTPTAGATSIEVTPGANDYADKFELGVAPLPKIAATGQYPTPFINNKMIFIGANSSGDKLKTAKTFVEFLASPEQQQLMAEQGFAPTTQVALNSETVKSNPVLSGLLAQLAVAKPQPAAPQLRAVWDAILPNLQAVVAGTVTPKDAAKKMQDMALQKVKLLAMGN